MMGRMASEETRTTKAPNVRDAPHTPGARGSATSDFQGAAVPVGDATRAWAIRLVVIGIVLSALNLRPAITSLGALLEEVRDSLGMSGGVAGLLTSVPPLCFAVFGGMAPRLARRFGAGAVVCAGMAAIAAGLLVRPYAGGTAGFLAGSALALMGIAVSNVLMPVIVKRWFPDRVGSMTGLYSMALALGTASAAAVTVPITEALGGNWRSGLAVWAVLAVTAMLPWIPLVRDRSTGSPASAAAEPAREEAPAAIRITRSRTAWALAVFFGLQATAAYVTMGWMAQIFRDAGDAREHGRTAARRTGRSPRCARPPAPPAWR
ncbi:CynX/NimT family MFS transporter OS=Streptomyces alboniger OX=132473 GN=CP975_07565 PE=4 SV=1 [Streptomyces alboniger]